MRITTSLITASIVISIALSTVTVQAQTQTPPMGQGASATAQLTAKVVAIDKDTREITLQDTQGNTQSYKASPDIKRFNDIKVGDTITFTYQVAVALNIVKADSAAPVPTNQATPEIARGTGEKPSGTISQTQTTTVTIQAIDMTKPSVTVKTQDGRVLDFAVQDKANLNGLKVGDVVRITYSEALVVTVK